MLAGAELCTRRGGTFAPAMAYVLAVQPSSGATAVQIVRTSRRGRAISSNFARLMKGADWWCWRLPLKRLALGQPRMDLGLAAARVGAGWRSLPRTPRSCGSHARAYEVLGFVRAGGDKAFRQRLLSRITNLVQASSNCSSLAASPKG